VTDSVFSAFSTLRPVQETIIRHLDKAADRTPVPATLTLTLALQAQTGSGKSLAAMEFAARLLGVKKKNQAPSGRIFYLTGTRQLQDQVMESFRGDGMTTLKGKSNYKCDLDARFSAADAPCNTGYKCPLKQSGCAYFSALRRAASSKIVVTNYACFLAHEGEKGFDGIDVLICDEWHTAGRWLESAAEVDMQETGQVFKLPLSEKSIPTGQALDQAEKVLKLEEERLKGLLENGGKSSEKFARSALAIIKAKLRSAARCRESLKSGIKWETLVAREKTVMISPITPEHLAPKLLFSRAKTCLIMSATLSLHDANQAGAADYFSAPDTLNPSRAPIHVYPVVRMDFRTDETGWARMMEALDNEIRKRRDRRILIHAGSYARMTRIAETSAWASSILTHAKGGSAKALAEFRSIPNAILASPSLTEGADLKDEDCRCIIWVKFPFPDTREFPASVRAGADKNFGICEGMKILEQGAGRGVRSVSDWCETIILDANFLWIRAKAVNLGLGSRSFWKRINITNTPPRPINFEN
jgi:Rad3-related DNA helicase